MEQHTMRIPNGILHYSSVDLEFEFEGEHTYMEFHHYCGPSFYTLKGDGYEDWIYPDDSPRYDKLWKIFYEWFNKPEQQHLHYKGE
jgi:hypothetical protein